MAKNVGVSQDRTPGKHIFLDKLLGKQVGAASQLVFKGVMRLPFVMIDLTAGDGADTLESGMCSPGILKKHGDWFCNRMHTDEAVIRILIEKDKATFDELQKSPYAKNAHLILGDATSEEVKAQIKELLFGKISHLSPVFITNDPNHVHGWALLTWLLELSDFVTTYSTLGCNVGGLKRMLHEVRLQWLEAIKPLIYHTTTKSQSKDCCLVHLLKDSHQWAYLTSVPSKWREDTVKSANAAFKNWPSGHDYSWLSKQDDFKEVLSFLFLTAAEFKQGMRIEL